ncbi:MAG: nicotinate-nucleotide adenylyltransferase [Cyanobacteria bacterium J06649_4]
MTSATSPTRVALFGTSADPPHMGHQSILLWLANTFDRVAVWAANNPYKAKQSPIRDRAEMLRLLIENLPVSDKVSVYQSLSDRYSINSVNLARDRWPNAHLSFVVGADLLPQLPKWYRAKEIFKQVDVLVFPRPGYPIQGPALNQLQQLATVKIAHPPNQYNISSSTYRQIHQKNYCEASTESFTKSPTDYTALDHLPADYTATPHTTAEESSPAYLPPVIRDYITENDLYPCPQPTPKAKISTHH